MRLTDPQIRSIRNTLAARLDGRCARIFLYGSRLDDGQRGGDVDLLLETTVPLPYFDRLRIKDDLERALGLPVDVSFHVAGHPYTPFQTMVLETAQEIARLDDVAH